MASEAEHADNSPPRDCPVVPRAGSFVVEKDPQPAGEMILESGIVMPVQSSKPVSTGTVVRGEGEWDVGARVLFSPYSGYELNVDGREYVLLSESEILGSFDGESRVSVS